MKNNSKNSLQAILRSSRTVFSFKELHLLSETGEPQNLISRLSYAVRSGDLHRIRRGLYAKDKNYSRFEAATKIMTPAYISFETVLRKAGMIFQHYEAIYIATTHSRSIMCDGQEYVYRRLKPEILTNKAGVKILESYSIATPERAFLDLLYLNNDYHLDNASPMDWKLVYELLALYDNKRMNKVVDQHYAAYKESLLE